jgi:hypothetical protein
MPENELMNELKHEWMRMNVIGKFSRFKCFGMPEIENLIHIDYNFFVSWKMVYVIELVSNLLHCVWFIVPF